MSATIRDVAKRAGVSQATVSRVLNRPELVKEETRANVLKAAEELGFVPNRLARGLITGRSGLVALIVQDISNPYFALVAAGCEEELHRSGIIATLVGTSESLNEEERVRQILAERSIDGFIFVSSPASLDAVEDRLIPNTIPTVYALRIPDAPHIDIVFPDNRQGACLACEHLASLGHHRVAIVTGQLETLSGQVRLEAFRECLNAKGIDLPPHYIIPGDFKLASGKAAAEQMLACDPLPTAVFVSSDLMAYAFIHTLAEAGVRVPEDISVIGFDDLPMSELFYPRLTTIWSPKRRLGAEAARLLVNRLENPDLPAQEVLLPVELKVRDSCRVIE
jgi:DNA-binding LacI/PurR family transcriptional regulator